MTAKERETLSFPAKFLLNKSLLISDVLDFGCGFGKDVVLLISKGIIITGYDKHYFPKYPTKKFDTIICFYVLNVLMQEEQATVLMQLSTLVKPTGKVYFAVRRDLQNEGFRIHKVHQKPTYQCNVTLAYKSIFKNENCEIYEYKHFNQIKKKENLFCPFCNPESERELKGISPDGNGVNDYFDLTFREQSACLFMLNALKEIISKKFLPDGFNVGINICEAAGQTISHVHIHLIPRYNGDVNEPRGGVRGVIPEKKNY